MLSWVGDHEMACSTPAELIRHVKADKLSKGERHNAFAKFRIDPIPDMAFMGCGNSTLLDLNTAAHSPLLSTFTLSMSEYLAL